MIKTNLIGIIPARSGSKGIKNKNLQIVGLYRLYERALLYAIKSGSFSHIIVTTDSFTIIDDIKKKFNALNIMNIENQAKLGQVYFHQRNSDLATDNSKIGDTFRILSELLESKEINYEGAVMLQPTTPFRQIKEIQEISKLLINNSKKDIGIVSVRKVEDSHPARMYTAYNERLIPWEKNSLMEFLPRQELPTVYLRDGGYYGLTPKMLREGIPVSSQSLFYVRNSPYNLNIDNEDDLKYAQFLASSEEILKNI